MNKIKYLGIILVCLECLIIGFCLLACFVPAFLPKETTNLIAISSFATALSTGITVVWAYFSLQTQQKSLIRQINLSVFSESIRLLMNSQMYNQGRDYIYSNKYDEDLEIVRQVLKKTPGSQVSLNDFRNILDNDYRGNNGTPIGPDDEKKLREAYDKIRFFCMRMEYLGVLSEENAAASLILDYFGYAIKTTYEKLEPLIKKTRMDQATPELYKHYTQLYDIATNNKK